MSPIVLSILVATVAIAIDFVLGTLFAWWLVTRKQLIWPQVLSNVLLLPMVLPPTVVGFGLLLGLGRGTEFGVWLNDSLGLHLLFTWQGASVAAAVMSFPLYAKSAEIAFREVDPAYLEMGKMSGAGPWNLFKKVMFPLSIRGLCAGGTLAYARALGEFGATMMVAGSIPGKTQTMPLALYDAVMAGENREALRLAVILTSVGFFLLGGFALLQSRVIWTQTRGST